MRKLAFSLFLILAAVTGAEAQTGLSGIVRDTAQKRTLTNAVVSVLNRSDSTLAGFARSGPDGRFSIPSLRPGPYVILVTYPKFADYTDDVVVKTEGTDVGQVALTPKSLLLNEVIVRSAAAIRIKGDTTEFTADSFVVKEGATVEDLLKKLPGFQVNAKGEITAQGKKVEKVLVDGEEFFGDDPTMATQNLSAKVVDKVQVFDNKTEQQNLTGITSGNEGKTINIKLKEDKKKGGFGKLIAGYDFDRLIDAKGLYNRFVGKKKLSLYATKSDVSTGSLNWEDRQKLGMENDMEYDEIGGYYYSYGNDDGFSDWSLRGLPHSYTAGGLYSNKWNADKQNANVSYRFNRLGTENIGSTFSQLILNDSTTNYRNVFSNSNGLNQQHAANGKYEWKIDSLASLKLTTSVLRKTTDQYSGSTTDYLDNERDTVYTINQAQEAHNIKQQMDNVLTYKQLFMKKNRQLIATFRYGLVDDDNFSLINSAQRFVRPSLPDSMKLVDQYKNFNGNSRTIGGKVTYNEPITAKWNLVLDYAHNQNRSYSYRNTFNKSSNGKYESYDPAFSNNFDLDAFSNSGNAILRYVDKKLRLAFGSGLSATKLNSRNVNESRDTTYRFLNLTPQAQVGYTFKPQTSISFNYRGTTRQPTITQLQPIRDNNNDGLNEFVGNPALLVGFNHSFSTFFNQYKVLQQRGIWVSMSYNITNNAIVNSVEIDPVTRKQTYRPVNTDGVHNWYFWGNWNKGGGAKKLAYGVQFNGNGGRNINFVNKNKNLSTYANAEFSVSLSYDNPDKWSFEMRPKIGRSTSSSSLNKTINNNFYSYGGYASGFVMLPGKIELRTDWQFDLRSRISAFAANTNIVQWNGSLGRKVFKKKTGNIMLVGNDILNQNKGFSRTINSYNIVEDRYARIARYFLLKFEWSFSKMPGAN
jgi:hypothetical protein